MGFVNKSCLSTAEFLFEVFSKTNILENGEELARIKEDLVISEEIKNQAVYNAANIKRGGYRLFDFNISFKDVYINIKELVKKDAAWLPYGLKYLMLVGLPLLLFSAIGAGYFIGFLHNFIDKNRENPYYFAVQTSYMMFLCLCVFTYTGSYVHNDVDLVKRRFKRKSYSIITMICSGLIYNTPFSVLALVMCATIIKAVFKISGVDSETLGLFEVLCLFLQAITLSIFQLWFSIYNPPKGIIGTIVFISKYVLFSRENYDYIVEGMICPPLLVPLMQKMLKLEVDSQILKTVSFLLTAVGKGLMGFVSPNRHISTAIAFHFIEKLKAKYFIDKPGSFIRRLGHEDSVKEVLSNLIYIRHVYSISEIEIDQNLEEKLKFLENMDDFISIFQKECSNKISYFGFGKYPSLLYVCALLLMIILMFSWITRRKFTAEVRLKL
ncbi:hypothetical protein ENBRE01_1557 [Enteropsectra breve]|nr:hypothetical protein ENBRE01_1557 [Enteropsectra breve]